MFSWICPQCGREVPPSYTECPDCKAREAAAPPPPQQPAPPPQQPVYPPPPQQAAYQPPAYQNQQTPYPPQPPAYQAQQPAYPPQPPAYAPPQAHQAYAAPRPRGVPGLPTWLLTLLFAFAFVGLVAGVYWAVGYLRGGSSSAATPASNVESPAAKPGAKTSPMQKYIEVSGIRFAEDAKKKLEVKFTLTNHSDADISGLAGNVTIWGRTQKSEEDAVGTFSFTGDIGPQTSREFTAPLTTKLKVYELPDWQNVTSDLQITAPQ